MRTPFISLITTIVIMAIGACSQKEKAGADNLVLIKGGTFKNTKSNLYRSGITISDFYLSQYEVTQKQWREVMGNNPSEFKGDSLPVEMVSWYDCVEYCNRKSTIEGLKPYYNIERNRKDTNNISELDTLKWTITANEGADGYRLPTEAEWEYAAGGGQDSKSLTYSGSDNIGEVAWFWQNSGDNSLSGDWHRITVKNNNCKTKPVGAKKPNELELYDMSGNVREWCWDWVGDSLYNLKGSGRALRGGGWLGGDFPCASSFRSANSPESKYNDQGFRLCRSK